MSPALYNLVINAVFFVLNIGIFLLLIYAWRCARMRDWVIGLFALATAFSIITSGCNAVGSLLRIIGWGPQNKDLISRAFHVVTVVEPLAMVAFYSALVILSLRVIRSKNSSES